MKCSEERADSESLDCRPRPEMPDFYMPAMWPLDLQDKAIEWFKVWRKRCLYRRLLRLSDRQLRARDLSRPRLMEKAYMPLCQLLAEQRDACKPR